MGDIMELLDLDTVKEYAPLTHRKYITKEFVNLINDCLLDPIIGEEFKSNLISYNSVLQNGKYKLVDYVKAVRYVSYKLLGKKNIEAYKLVFPQRYEKLIEKGVEDISPYVSAYNSNQLVVAIMQQTLVPSYVLNQHIHQDALNKLYNIAMGSDTKHRDAINACNSILEYTKLPEKTEMSLDINIGGSIIEEMQTALRDSAKNQLEIINQGGSLKNIIEAKLVEVVHE